MSRFRVLAALALLYTAASLTHFVHNAQFVADYPNLPPSLTAARIYMAWFAVAGVGAAGFLLLRWGFVLAGLCVVVVYAALGFDGLLHYTLAPLAAHTWAMNLTIWFEVFTASLLLVTAMSHLLR
jgi:hypothetical protein